MAAGATDATHQPAVALCSPGLLARCAPSEGSRLERSQSAGLGWRSKGPVELCECILVLLVFVAAQLSQPSRRALPHLLPGQLYAIRPPSPSSAE